MDGGGERRELGREAGARDCLERWIEALPTAVLGLDADGIVRHANADAAALFARSAEQLRGRPADALFSREFRVLQEESIRRHGSSAAAEAVGGEVVGRRAEGEEFPVEVSLRGLDTADGPIFLCALDDAGRRRADERVFRMATESAPSALVMADDSGRVILFNSESERIFGYTREEVLGQPIEMLLPERFAARHPALRAQFHADPRRRAMGAGTELLARRKYGTEFPVEIGLNPIRTERGVLVLASVVDVSVRRRQEESIQRYARELERRNQELDEFAGVVSHDLKAPLRSIGTVVEWLLEDLQGLLDEGGRKNLDLLVDRARRMDGLVDGILAYCRAGSSSGTFESVDSRRAVQRVVDTLSVPPGIDIALEGPFPNVKCLRVQLEQILQNLIGNAVQHMGKERGRVTVSAEDLGEVWRFCVADDGAGIEERHFQRIFTIFHTLRPKRDTSSPTGIGLSIVKSLVEKNGGRVWVESELGRGSRFFFTMRKDPAFDLSKAGVEPGDELRAAKGP